ncbi:MAG: hypothetical protein ACJ8F7_14415 [Gemmataceae bacterium]
MTPQGRSGRRLLTLFALLALPGCFGCTQNPSVFPYWLPAGPIIRTHAKPPGMGNFANFDPAAIRLEVRPLVSTNPVRSEHLVVATVLDEKGEPRRKRRIEWMLEGAGNIVEVDERGYLAGRGYKVDNKYAISYTDYFEHTVIHRGGKAEDDFAIEPGQTWCIISSAVDGDSQLTIYAPEIFDHDKRTVVATTHWVDCQWQFPAAATVRAGATHTLTTNLYRHSDRAPLPSYRVRYTLLDGGPAAKLLPNNTREVTVASDRSGNAQATVGQLNLQAGINRVGVEIFRPVNPLDPNSPPVTVAKTETTIDWQAPQVVVNIDVPPTVVVDQDIPATITVTNNGKVDSQPGDVSLELPPMVSFIRSTPEPVSVVNGVYTWRLTSLGSGREQKIQATLRPRQTGVFSTTSLVKTGDGLQAQKAASLRVDKSQLQVSIDPTRTALMGESVSLPITVTNPSNGGTATISIEVLMEDGLEVSTSNGPLMGKVTRPNEAPLGPNETRTIKFSVVPRKEGALQLSVFVRADGGLQAQAVSTITVQKPLIEIARRGPENVNLGKDATWTLTVRNAGQTPLSYTMLRERLPIELTLRNVADGGQYNPPSGEIVWNLGALNAGEERVVRYTATGNRLTTRGVLSGTLTASPSIEQKSESSIRVLGVPAVRVEVSGANNPINVGQRNDYTIRVMNQGTLPVNDVVVEATLSSQLRGLQARGAQPGRIDGQRVVFPPISTLQPGQVVTVILTAQAASDGDARVHVETRTQATPTPLVEEQATRVLPALNTSR